MGENKNILHNKIAEDEPKHNTISKSETVEEGKVGSTFNIPDILGS